jgi:PIN domain nuclease of toxin-antitoxin system
MLNLDSHILIFALQAELTKREEKLLRSDQWCISDIVLWEISMLCRLGRIKISLDDKDVISALSQIQILPITIDIVRNIKNLDFKSDPADEIIAATSTHHRIPLITRDKKILTSKVVPFAK